MLIISRFTDYYDFIPNLYGIDKKIIFNRNNKLPKEIKLISPIECSNHLIFKFSSNNKNIVIEIRYLIFCYEIFLIIKFFDRIKNQYISQSFLTFDEFLVSRTFCKDQFSIKYFFNKENCLSIVKSLTNQVKMPYFIIDNSYSTKNKCQSYKTYILEENLPKLSDYAFYRIYTPEQCYQTIYHFLINNVFNPPDKLCPITIGNTEKILKHGFDIKASFRSNLKKE